jgi:hypothetical protein
MSFPSPVISTPDFFRCRRMAINYQFLNYGAAEECLWKEMNLASIVTDNFFIPRGNRDRTFKIPRDCLQSINNKMDYDPNACFADQPKL